MSFGSGSNFLHCPEPPSNFSDSFQGVHLWVVLEPLDQLDGCLPVLLFHAAYPIRLSCAAA